MLQLIERELGHAAIPSLSRNGGPRSYDISTPHDVLVAPWSRHAVAIDLAIHIPAGYYGRMAPRSGPTLGNGAHVLAGEIDSDYRGTVCVLLMNLTDQPFALKRGDRSAQLIIEHCATVDVAEADPDSGNRGDILSDLGQQAVADVSFVAPTAPAYIAP